MFDPATSLNILPPWINKLPWRQCSFRALDYKILAWSLLPFQAWNRIKI